MIFIIYRFRWLSLVGCLHDGWFDSDHQGSTRTSRCGWSARCCVEPKFHPGSLGKMAPLSICCFNWVGKLPKFQQIGKTPAFFLDDVFRCCCNVLLNIAPWCVQLKFPSSQSSSHWSLMYRMVRGENVVLLEFKQSLWTTWQMRLMSLMRTQPIRAVLTDWEVKLVFFQATCNSDVRLPLKKESGTNFIYQKRTVTNNII